MGGLARAPECSIAESASRRVMKRLRLADRNGLRA